MKVLRKAKSTDFLGRMGSEVKDYAVTGDADDKQSADGCCTNRSRNSRDKTSIHNRIFE